LRRTVQEDIVQKTWFWRNIADDSDTPDTPDTPKEVVKQFLSTVASSEALVLDYNV